MGTIFMNTLNSKANESNKFIYQFTANKNMALANLSIYYSWKTLNKSIIIINLKYLHLLGMIFLIYLMDLIQFLIFKIILNISSKNMKLLQIFIPQ